MKHLLLLLSLFVAMGCAGDDSVAPAYKHVLGEALTDGECRFVRFRADDGSEWGVESTLTFERPDTAYRVAANVCDEDPEARTLRVADLSQVVSIAPKTYAAADLTHDPVKVVTAWRTERYVNLRIEVEKGERPHYVGFADEGVEVAADGVRTQVISLMHDANGDGNYYRQEFLMSCPVWQYADVLERGRDQVRFVVHTPSGPYVLTTPF